MIPERPHTSDATRQAILRAAMEVFAQEGVAGARTEAVARVAGVNKALIHYHFRTKEGLYDAVLDAVFEGQAATALAILEGPGTPGERVLRHFLGHFDLLEASWTLRRLLSHEMARARSGEPDRVARIVAIAFRPIHEALVAVLAEGAAQGELRDVPPGPLVVALTGANVFYFASTPFFREITGRDPRDPDLVARQRESLLDVAARVLFTDLERGCQLAAAILRDTPRTGPAAGRTRT